MLFQKIAWVLYVVFNVLADPVVRPRNQYLKQHGSGVVNCVFNTPLTACRIRVSDHYANRFDTLMDFTRGAWAPSVAINSKVIFSYAGNGLNITRGECGIKVDVNFRSSIMFVECFGRTQDDQWDRGFATITTSKRILPVTSDTPHLQVGAPGANLSVLIKADKELFFCAVSTPSAGLLVMSSGEDLQSFSRYVPYAAGAANHECGATLTNVQESDAGIWITSAYDSNREPWSTVYQPTVVLVVAAPVGEPVLTIKDADRLVPGKLLEAKCVAPPAVPHANLTWLLGGHVVRQDNLNDTLPGEVGTSRPWHRQPLHQTFKRILTVEDMGKVLECRMTHRSLAGPRIVGLEIQGLGNEDEDVIVQAMTQAETTPTETTLTETTVT